jgi:hypothetical protein
LEYINKVNIPNYSHYHCIKRGFLFAQVLAEACGAEISERLLLPTVLNLAGDAVPNVRFNIAKCLATIGPKLSSS